MSYVFGPVASRRLGRSLGIDLVPYKTCPYDCSYCQLGHTTTLTLERREWVPLDAILAELATKMATRPDYVTLGGSGEPTLHSRLGELISHIRAHYDTRVAVLTNGALLFDPQVRHELAHASLVIPSLDAGDQTLFQAVNRPHSSIGFEQMVEGLAAFRKEFAGEIWLEVFLLAGQTDTLEQAQKLARCAARIAPNRVQLNTVARPPADGSAVGVSRTRLEELAALFTPPAEIIADFRAAAPTPSRAAAPEEVLELLRRHPCTAEIIAQGLGCSSDALHACLEELLREGKIERLCVEGSSERFYGVSDLHGAPVG